VGMGMSLCECRRRHGPTVLRVPKPCQGTRGSCQEEVPRQNRQLYKKQEKVHSTHVYGYSIYSICCKKFKETEVLTLKALLTPIIQQKPVS